MSTQLVSVVDPGITYREEYVCDCGRTILITAKGGPGPSAGDSGYRHDCGYDVSHVLPGSLYAIWERRDDKWIAV